MAPARFSRVTASPWLAPCSERPLTARMTSPSRRCLAEVGGREGGIAIVFSLAHKHTCRSVGFYPRYDNGDAVLYSTLHTEV